jgi:predicted amidohydrolase YtcJ
MKPDLAIVGARIRTLDPERPFASAVACAEGRVLAVGDDAEIRALGGAQSIDAGGRALVPGLVDGHAHPIWGNVLSRGANLDGCMSVDSVSAALAAERDRVPDGAWVFGWSLDYDAFPDGQLDPALLERAVGGAPALVRCVDGHAAIATQRALALAGVTEPVSFADGAKIEFRDGRPTGLLHEMSAIGLVLDAAPALSAAELRALALGTFRDMAACGLTAVHAMDGDPSHYELLRALEADGDLPLRVVAPLWFQPDVDDATIADWLALVGERGRRWRGGVAKFFADGVIGSGTAWLEEPDTLGDGTAPFWPDPERYAEVVARCAAAGFQCVTHAIGDRAMRAALDAYAAAGAAPGVRHRIEHLEILTDALIERVAAEGVVASMQPIHLRNLRGDGTGAWAERLGPERAARAFRAADVLHAGAILALGSDWPIAPFDPRLGLAAAQLRRNPQLPDEAPIAPAQALTALEALAGYTTGCAAAVGEPPRRIAPGLPAHFTGFAADPVDTPADELLGLPVWLTVVDGTVVHAA